MPQILIPAPLRQYAAGQSSVEAPGATVAEVLTALTSKYPDLRKHLFNDQGALRSFVNVYVADEDIRYLQKEQTAVSANETLTIVPSIAGGAR
ncbi:MAG: MoaD/ThiS family protein [Acidobacteria bacterium]|nr:MoaD/ThiS family protein [Acidobacteriota bacterium]